MEDKASAHSGSEPFNPSSGASSALIAPILNGLGKLDLCRSKAPWLWAVGVSVLTAGIGGLARWALLGASTPRFPYLTFYSAVIVAALVGKWRCGLLTVVFSALLVHTVFVPLSDSLGWLGLLFFILNNGFIVLVLELFTRYRSRALVAEATQSLDAQLAAIVQSSSDAIISKTLDGTITSWNAGATRIFGYSAEEMIGQPIKCLISPEQVGEESEVLSRLKKGERIKDYETSRIAKDGRKLNVSLTISPVKNASGALIGCSTIIRDITERKRAEIALKEREIRLSFSKEGGSIGTWDWDIATNRLHWSEVQCALFGIDPAKRDSVSYDDWLATVHPDDRARQIELLQNALSSGGNDPDPDEAYRIIRLDGVRWINARGRVQRDANGKGVRMFGVTLDITERKRAEQRLAESEARFRAAQEASLDAFLIYEPIKNEAGLIVDLKIVYANSKAAEFFHLHPEEVEGTLLGDLLPHSKLAGGLIAQLGRIYQTGRPVEFVFDYDADGSMNYFHNSIAPFGAYIANTFRNITAQVEGTIALTAAKAEAESANVAKSKFIAAASHDLRQPVQSLTLLMEVIKRQAKDRPKIMELADMAQASVSGLNGMLTGILDVSKLDAGVIAPVMASTDIGELVERLALEYRPRAAVNGLELRYLPRCLRASTDASLLERIVRNLIENALRYTAKGGVLVGVRQRGEFVRLDVIDTGIGIPADQQVEIFDEFRQLNNPARDSSKGLGLGLAIVSRLARLLGIRVEVASRVGLGTRFSLLLPLDRTEIVTPEVTAPAGDSGGRILIIEDNADVRHAYELMLSDWGYETISAANGEDALERAAHEDCRFDAILADHRLGAGLTGTAASSEIARRANRTFPTLVVTGDTAKERIVEIKSSGFGMLHKPVEAEDLHRALTELFRENVRLLSETGPDSPPCAKNPPPNC